MKETLSLRYTSDDISRGSIEVRRSWSIEMPSNEEVVLVKDYKRVSFPSDAVRDHTVVRLTVSVDDLIAFFEAKGART